ncbi:hypothetical protein KKF29_01000, partial [Patescibacteria group bacterium]|nr:hypothetical protein [Patescibacteria group bacterium]
MEGFPDTDATIMKKLFMVATFFIFVASLFVMGFSQAQASGVVTPTLLAPAEGDSYDLRQPAIRGVTKNNTRVAIYIDDVFNGYA